MNASPTTHHGAFLVAIVAVPDGRTPDRMNHEAQLAAAASVLTSPPGKETQMGGSIHYRDGRKRSTWVLGYEFVYIRTAFEPLPKRNKPAWSVW